MTRIFDALRKSQAGREPAVLPAPPVIQTLRPSASPERRIERMDVVPLGHAAPLDDDVVREMNSLRVSLEGAMANRRPRSVVMISPQGGDGTSTVALQFAEVLAREVDLRVLIVDANLRRPAPILDTAVASRASTEGRRRGGALDLLPLGDRLRGGQTLPVESIRDLIERAGAGYDWVVVDGSPLLDSPESAPIAAQFDGVVIVVRSGRTKRPVLNRAIDLLRRSNANVLGTVLNRRRLEIPDFIYRRI